MSVLSRMGSYCPVCDSHAMFRWIAWYRVACSSSRMMTAKGAGQDLILSKNSPLCLCTWSRARFVLVYRNRSSFHTGGPWDAVGAIVFQEKKWDFCVAKVLKLCLWGGKDPCQLPRGTELGVHEYLRSVWAVWFSWAFLWRCCKKSVSWSLGICPCCIIRWDFCLLFRFILHLHPTVHKENLASVTWEAAVFQRFPKFPPERDYVTSDPDAYGKQSVSAQWVWGETLTQRSQSQLWG